MDEVCDPAFENCDLISPDLSSEETYQYLEKLHISNHLDMIDGDVIGSIWYLLMPLMAASFPIIWNFMYRTTYFTTYDTISLYYKIGW